MIWLTVSLIYFIFITFWLPGEPESIQNNKNMPHKRMKQSPIQNLKSKKTINTLVFTQKEFYKTFYSRAGGELGLKAVIWQTPGWI